MKIKEIMIAAAKLLGIEQEITAYCNGESEICENAQILLDCFQEIEREMEEQVEKFTNSHRDLLSFGKAFSMVIIPKGNTFEKVEFRRFRKKACLFCMVVMGQSIL